MSLQLGSQTPAHSCPRYVDRTLQRSAVATSQQEKKPESNKEQEASKIAPQREPSNERDLETSRKQWEHRKSKIIIQKTSEEPAPSVGCHWTEDRSRDPAGTPSVFDGPHE